MRKRFSNWLQLQYRSSIYEQIFRGINDESRVIDMNPVGEKISIYAFGSSNGVTARFEFRDYLLIPFLLEKLVDIPQYLFQLKAKSSGEARLVFVTYNRLWLPLIILLENLGLKTRSDRSNYFSKELFRTIIEDSGFVVIKEDYVGLIPFSDKWGISRRLNAFIGALPLSGVFSTAQVLIARKRSDSNEGAPVKSVSVIVPCRNEYGNIEEICRRIPRLAPQQEVIFVEGGSADRTWEKIQEFLPSLQAKGIGAISFKQDGVGKGDAVRKGIEKSQMEIAVILDADLSVDPEALHYFVGPLQNGECEFTNGTRLVYGMEAGAMRFLNRIGNRSFAALVSYLIGFELSDTLCGTKAFFVADYKAGLGSREIMLKRDPFGDFELLFLASSRNLQIREVPVHYRARVYGASNISRFRDGWKLLVAIRAEQVRRNSFKRVVPTGSSEIELGKSNQLFPRYNPN